MPPLVPRDQAILKKLIAAGMVDAGEVEELIQSLERYRVETPDLTLFDLLVDKNVLTAAQARKLQSAPTRPAAPEKAGPKPATPIRRRAPRRSAPPPPPQRSPLLIAGTVLGVTIAIAAAYMLWPKPNDAVVSPRPSDRVAGPVDLPPRFAPPVSPSIATPDDSPRLGNEEGGLVARCRMQFEVLQAESHPRKKVEGLANLLEACRDRDLRSEIQRELDATRERIDVEAQREYSAREEELLDAIQRDDVKAAFDICKTLLERFGRRALGGRLLRSYDDALLAVEAQSDSHLEAGKQAFEKQDTERARTEFAAVIDLGDETSVRKARNWLARIDEQTEPVAVVATPTAIVPAKGDPIPPGALAPEEPTESFEGDPEATSKESLAEVTRKPEALTIVQENLSGLFAAHAELDDAGILSITYGFDSKNLLEAKDWLPDIERAGIQEPVRWSLLQEEEASWAVGEGRRGVRVSDAGVFRHKALLEPPITIDLVYYPMNQFSSANVVAIAWVDEKGRGVGTNFGLQNSLVTKYRAHKHVPPRLPALTANRSYPFCLQVSEGYFRGEDRGRPTPDRKVPKRMSVGHCAVVWSGKIAGTLESVTLSGKLNLEWAREALGR